MKKILLLSFLLIPKLSLACSCDELTEEQLFENAKAVYLAKVTDTKLIKNDDSVKNQAIQSATFGPEAIEIIEAKFEILEKFKNSKEEIQTLHDLPFAPGNCSIALMSGQHYIIYIPKESSNINYVGMCTGSQMVNMQYKGLEKNLEKLRKISEKASEK